MPIFSSSPVRCVETVKYFPPYAAFSHSNENLAESQMWCDADVLPFQLVRIATPEFGVSKMPLCLEPFLLPTHPPKMLFPVWCFLRDLEVDEEFLACSWLSNRIFTTSPITDATDTLF